MSNPENRFFYGWVIVGVSFIVLAAGTTLWFSFPIFYVEILNQFNWGRAATAIFFSLGGIIYGISSPIAGFLFDRFGPRKAFSAAALILALGALGTSQSNQIWQFCLAYGVVLAFGVALVGFPPAVALVSNWFVKRRGTALGFAQMGLQGTFLIAPLIQFLILTVGWRSTYQLLAAAVFIIIAPLSIAFLRHRPQDIGLQPDGATGSSESGETDTHEIDSLIADKEWASTEWSLVKALKTYRSIRYTGQRGYLYLM
jgi:MFS family permease